MEKLFSAVAEALRRGEGAALCTILSSTGSAPRGAGAQMAVFPDGSIAGTVGGGAAERLAREEALAVLRRGKPCLRVFRLYPNDSEDIGMVCGGTITVAIQALGAAALPLLEELCALQTGASPAWLVTAMPADGAWFMEIWTGEGPEKPFLPPDRVRPLLGKRPALEEGEPAIFAQPVARQGMVYIFGAGHVGRELAWLLDRLEYRLTVFDDRPEALAPECFPKGARLMLGDFGRIGLPLTAADAAVVMTAGHRADLTILEQVLRTPAGYIGCIGSKKKAAAVRKMLKENSFTDAEILRIHSPIGLPIGGETPAEIAVSIAAELIVCRSGRGLPHG